MLQLQPSSSSPNKNRKEPSKRIHHLIRCQWWSMENSNLTFEWWTSNLITFHWSLDSLPKVRSWLWNTTKFQGLACHRVTRLDIWVVVTWVKELSENGDRPIVYEHKLFSFEHHLNMLEDFNIRYCWVRRLRSRVVFYFITYS